MNSLLQQLTLDRESLIAAMDTVLERAANTETHELGDIDKVNYDAMREKIATLETRIRELAEDEATRKATEAVMATVDPNAGTQRSNRVVVTNEPELYRQDQSATGETSFFRDAINYGRSQGATDRMNRHAEFTRASNTATFGDSGGFVPPEWMLSKYAEFARAGRPVTELIQNLGAPTSTVEKIPRITSGLTVARQTTQNSSVGSSDTAVSDVTVNTQTLAGYTDISEQSITLGKLPDNLIFQMLVQDFAVVQEADVLSSTVAGYKGITQVAGINTVTYTDASPTVGELYASLTYAMSLIQSNRYLPADVIIVDPTMAWWIMSQRDTTGRPLVTDINPQNSFATAKDGSAAVEGYSFTLLGLPVVVSASLAADSATPADRDIVIARLADSIRWESSMQLQTFPDVGSANATVRFRILAHVAHTHERQPKSIAVVQGTGTAITSANFV